MRIELTEFVWVEEQILSFDELADLSGLSPAVLSELVHGGGIQPLVPEEPQPRYGSVALMAARHARQLREDFELDTSALLLVLGLCDRVAELETRLRELQAKLPRRLV